MSIAIFALLCSVFLVTAWVVWAVASRLLERAETRRRFQKLSSSGDEAAGGFFGESWARDLERVAAPMATLAMPTDEGEVSKLCRSLIQAGWRGDKALPVFVLARVALCIGLPIIVWLAWAVVPAVRVAVSSATALAALLLLSAAAGYVAPVVLYRVKISQRQRALLDAFPDALDLMLICVESGLALDAAIQRVALEIRSRSPVLAEELSVLSAEIRAGSPREQAMRRLAMRTGLPEVQSFVTLIVQADRFGTSIGDALRVQSDALRTTRRLRAEERAAKVPVKLLFPLVFCIFPALFTVLLGPAAIRVWRILVPALQSGV